MPESPPQLLFPGHVHPNKPPLAPETKILLWKAYRPVYGTVRYGAWDMDMYLLEMGFWEPDGQTRSEALQAVCRT